MKTVVNWVIDKYIFEDYEERLIEAIKKSGMAVHLYDDVNEVNLQRFLGKKLKDDDIVLFHGSIQHGRRMLKTAYYPGIYLTLENYECYNYYGFYGDHLLNSNYMMMGLNDVLRNKERILDYFPFHNNVFIRPSNGFKSFTGQLLPKANFTFEFNVLCQSYGGLDMNTLCVISNEQKIEEEYRFVVIDGEVISGSLYIDNNNRKEWKAYYNKECTDVNAIKFAEKMAKIYQPDRAFNIDVCRLPNGDYKLLEINSFCCGSMYGCNLEKVVDAVNNLCLNDYNDVY